MSIWIVLLPKRERKEKYIDFPYSFTSHLYLNKCGSCTKVGDGECVCIYIQLFDIDYIDFFCLNSF